MGTFLSRIFGSVCYPFSFKLCVIRVYSLQQHLNSKQKTHNTTNKQKSLLRLEGRMRTGSRKNLISKKKKRGSLRQTIHSLNRMLKRELDVASPSVSPT